jgi:outer membrane protein
MAVPFPVWKRILIKKEIYTIEKGELFLKTIKLIALLFVLTVLFAFSNADAQIKVGYVDSEVILKQLPEAQRVQTELEGMQKLYLDTITARENDLKGKAETFKTKYEDAQRRVQAGQVSETEIQTLNDEIAGLQNELQVLDEGLSVYKQKVQNDLLAKQQELMKPVREKVVKAIETTAKGMKINFVFDKAEGMLLYGDKEYDITFKVLDSLK